MTRSSSRFVRPYRGRKAHERIYIFTEGTETEPNYFKSIRRDLRLSNVEIQIQGTGYNTTSLVDRAISFKQINKMDIARGDEVWVVFDKDDHRGFDGSIEKAEKNNIKVAYSNESFELWFLLHFDYLNTVLTRGVLCKKLGERLRKLSGRESKYKKNSTDIYNQIKHLEETAVKNAERLLMEHRGKKLCSKKNPSTTVHLLVCRLNSLKG